MAFDAKDDHSLTMGAGAPASAPSFSATLTAAEVEWMRMEIEAAGKERDALERYEQTQRELFQHSRDVMLSALRREVASKQEAQERADFLERQLAEEYSKPRLAWVVSAALSFGFWAGVFWVVTR